MVPASGAVRGEKRKGLPEGNLRGLRCPRVLRFRAGVKKRQTGQAGRVPTTRIPTPFRPCPPGSCRSFFSASYPRHRTLL